MVSGRRSSSGGDALGPLPPVSSKAKDYSERPDEVVDELDDLRTMGIAKVLNKHFTNTTKRLAMEKAQADSALADLERRRAQTKTFVPSKGGDLNPYDQLYVQLQQKRSECRRKEKETMMLYQRYVMKYGKSAKTAPLVVTKGEACHASKNPQDGGKEDSIRSSSEHQCDPTGKSALGTLDENSEINFSKFYEKQQQKQNEKQSNEDGEENVVHFMSALNKFMAVSDEQPQTNGEVCNKSEDAGVPRLVSSKDSSHLTDPNSLEEPSPVSAQVNTFVSAISNFTTDKDEELEDDDVQSDIAIRTTENANRIEPGTGDDNDQVGNSIKDIIITSDTSMDNDDDLFHRKSETSRTEIENVVRNESNSIPGKHDDDDNDDDEKIALSTPDIIPQAAAISISPSSYPSTVRRKVVMEVNNDTPCFATTTVEGYDADDRSIISELTTANSAVTRQILDEVETEMEDFIKNEMEAIRRMLDSEEDSSTINHSLTGEQSESSSLMAGDESVHVAMKAEAMALEMQKILDDFAKEDANSVHEELAQSNEKEITTKSVYPYKFEPALPEEEWYVHFDETYQKEFYVEKKSKRTQWDYPTKIKTPQMEQQPVSSDEFLSDMHSVASSRKSLSRRSSRRSLYRKQRKRRRARRLMISSVALLCVLVTVFYWRMRHPDETVFGAMTALVVSLKSIDIAETKAYFINQTKQTKTRVIDQFEYLFTDRRAREEAEIARLQTYIRAEKEREARELTATAQKAKAAAEKAKEEEETGRIAKEKAAREEAVRRLVREEAQRLAEIEKKMKQDKRMVEKVALEIEPKSTEKDRTGHRMWYCNVPLAYIVPHCFRLASTQPLHRESDLKSWQ